MKTLYLRRPITGHSMINGIRVPYKIDKFVFDQLKPGETPPSGDLINSVASSMVDADTALSPKVADLGNLDLEKGISETIRPVFMGLPE